MTFSLEPFLVTEVPAVSEPRLQAMSSILTQNSPLKGGQLALSKAGANRHQTSPK